MQRFTESNGRHRGGPLRLPETEARTQARDVVIWLFGPNHRRRCPSRGAVEKGVF